MSDLQKGEDKIMTKIDIFSGFLGAGKTTLIKKLLKEALNGEQVVLIENEFGEIGVDGGFLKEAGIEIKEMNSGCICCSLVGDFGTSLKEVLSTYKPDRILIEPSGVGKLSDVMKAVRNAIDEHDVVLNSAVAVVDASKAKMYIKNFGEFFNNQIEHAGTIVLSRTQNIDKDKLDRTIELIRQYNEKATIVTTPWDDLNGKTILDTIEGAKDLEAELMEAALKVPDEEHHHHHDHDEDEHEHHHHHDHDEDEHEHHHHHHHADEIFDSYGIETPSAYSKAEIETILSALSDEEKYGIVLRAKGMVPSTEGGWIYFDYVPEETNIRSGEPDVTGKICIIGSKIKHHELEELVKK